MSKTNSMCLRVKHHYQLIYVLVPFYFVVLSSSFFTSPWNSIGRKQIKSITSRGPVGKQKNYNGETEI